jgi:hypothetical protein
VDLRQSCDLVGRSAWPRRTEARDDGGGEWFSGLFKGLANEPAELFVGPTIDGDTDKRASEQPALLKPAQRA